LSTLWSRAFDADSPAIKGQGIASLAPSITATLLALDGHQRLQLISDFCPPVSDLPRGGTALSPDLERILRSGAKILLAREAAGVPVDALGRVGVPVVLPWSNVDDLCYSIEKLGEISGARERAQELVHEMKSGLIARDTHQSPRILLVIGGALDRSGGPWVIRDDSLHGQVLRAAGYRNALTADLPGTPRISMETLIEIDPDAIIHLVPAWEDPVSGREAVLDSYTGIPGMKAVAGGAIGTIHDPAILDEGPGLLALVEQLRKAIDLLPMESSEARR